MKIQWGRIVLAALVIEAILGATFTRLGPIIRSEFGSRVYLTFEGVFGFAVAFLVTMWLARKIESHLVLHGLLIGLVARLPFFGLMVGSGALTRFINSRGVVWFWLAQVLAVAATVLGARVCEMKRPDRAKDLVKVT
jgi:hypothetical protein